VPVVDWSSSLVAVGAKSGFAPHALDVFVEIYKAQSEAFGEGVQQPSSTTFNATT